MPINYKLYPPEWRDVIRPEALKRANYRCQKCGAGQRKHGYRDSNNQFIECDDFLYNWATVNGFKVIKVYLQVSHIDHDISNNDPSNLQVLCQGCHNRFDAKHRAANRRRRPRN